MSNEKKENKKHVRHTVLGKIKRKTVLVNMVTKYLPNGLSVLSPCKPRVYDIIHTYVGGSVRTNTGDVWKVKPHSGNEADFIIDEGGRA